MTCSEVTRCLAHLPLYYILCGSVMYIIGEREVIDTCVQINVKLVVLLTSLCVIYALALFTGCVAYI